MREVEIIKIGDLIGNVTGTINEGKHIGALKPMVKVVVDCNETVDYYTAKFLNKMNPVFLELKIDLILQPYMEPNQRFGDLRSGKIYDGHGRKGREDGKPIIGESYTLDNSSWHTSRVCAIVEDCILMTKNSIYAIHDTSTFRNKKLEDLGI